MRAGKLIPIDVKVARRVARFARLHRVVVHPSSPAMRIKPADLDDALDDGRLRRHGQLRDGPGVNVDALTQYLYDSSDIIAFWNYIPLAYCVKSRLTAAELRSKLRPFFGSNGFMVAEINPQNIDGFLPQAAWEWFYLPHHEKQRRPVTAISDRGILEALLGSASPDFRALPLPPKRR
jgi:hypothetical protein